MNDFEKRVLDAFDSQAQLELRYNPYHDPRNGRFTTAGGGGGGGVLFVGKGQKGKGAYVYERDIDAEFEKWQKAKSRFTATKEQQQLIDKMERKLTVGSKGTSRYGGSGSTIIEAPTFTQNSDGSINYRLVGQKIVKGEKSVVMGSGGIKPHIRTTISTGTINRYGNTINMKNEIKERYSTSNRALKNALDNQLSFG